MKAHVTRFEYSNYRFDRKNASVRFFYRTHFSNGTSHEWCEQLFFPKPLPAISHIPSKLLDQALSHLHIMLGISYYKLHCARKITLSTKLSSQQATFWKTVYQKGLGEFLYKNGIDPEHVPSFPASDIPVNKPQRIKRQPRCLVGMGAGKDSLVSATLLRKATWPITGFIVKSHTHPHIAEDICKRFSIPTLTVTRILDEKLLAKDTQFLTGHIPISAIFAWIGFLVALLFDYQYIVMSNEDSSNVGNLTHKGMEINHQWSKSVEFEVLFQDYIRHYFSPDISYFSLLRPFSEIRIAKMFSRYPSYFPFFTSCNRNFVIGKRPHISSRWCNTCAKCVFVFTLLAAFVSKRSLLTIFGENLFENSSLLPLFQDLLGLGGIKPFDCVGTFEEMQVAFTLAAKRFSDTSIVQTLLPKITVSKKQEEHVFHPRQALTVPTPFRFLGMENVLLLGFGKEGHISKAYLKKYYPQLTYGIADKQKNPAYLLMQDRFDVGMRSPGVNKHAIHMQYTTATNIFLSRNAAKTIGVTGTKGKSTTASLIFHILASTHHPVELLGNIGTPMLSALLEDKQEEKRFIVELSSYQCDDIEYAPAILVVVNLFPEHMNYHGNIEKYYDAKKRVVSLLKSTDIFVYNPHFPILGEWAKETHAHAIPIASLLPVTTNHLPLQGEHNRQNINAALTVAQMVNIPLNKAIATLPTFQPLPHRLEHIGTFRGISFYDDAISTTPESTIMAIRALSSIDTIFLGGEDRGYDFSSLEQELTKASIRNIVLFPDSGSKILSHKTSRFNILRTRSMKHAVQFAYQYTKPGSICLLSTASPSYSLWKNFEEKGSEFQTLVHRFSLEKK